MTFKYTPGEQSIWQGRRGELPGEKLFHQVEATDLETIGSSSFKDITLIGFKSDEGVRRNQGRIGATEGPAQLRVALGNISLHSQKNWSIGDVGNVQCDLDGDLDQAQDLLSEKITEIIQARSLPIVLGGGHETAWGHFQGLAEALPDKKIGIVNFDAHFDIRKPEGGQGSSGTPFWQAAQYCKTNQRKFDYTVLGIQESANSKRMFKDAQELGVHYIKAEDIHANAQAADNMIEQTIEHSDCIYISICLDVFSSAFAPGVSAPQPLGLFPHQVLTPLRDIASSGKLIAIDVVELNPIYDHDHLTAKLGAQLIAHLINNRI